MHTKYEQCPDCAGSGHDHTKPPHTHGYPICQRCWGTGKIFTAVIDASDLFQSDKSVVIVPESYEALLAENNHLWEAHRLLMALYKALEGVELPSNELAGLLDSVDAYFESETLPGDVEER